MSENDLMIMASAALDMISGRGLKAEIRSGVLYVKPRQAIDEELREVIRKNMPQLLALLAADDSDVQWRVAAILGQLLPLSWPCPVPTLHAKSASEPNIEACASCGEMLDIGEGDSYLCGPCARAKDIALDLWMQRPAQTARAA